MWRVTGWTYCPPPRYSRTLVICADLWSRQSGPDASCDRHSVALALSPLISVVMTPCYCGMLGGLHVLVGSLAGTYV